MRRQRTTKPDTHILLLDIKFIAQQTLSIFIDRWLRSEFCRLAIFSFWRSRSMALTILN